MSWKSLLATFIVITIFLFPFSIFSQGEATMLFLRIPPSPTLNGMGRVGVALPNEDPLGFHHNAAQLGYLSPDMNFAFQFYPSKTDWLPQFNLGDLTYNSYALFFGYNLKNVIHWLPISFGMGYMNGEINYGESIQTNNQGEIINRFESKEYCNAYGIGIGINYFVNLNFGLTFKKIHSKLDPGILVGGEKSSGEAKVNAIDYGVLIIVPTMSLVKDKIYLTSKNLFLPYFDVSFGYAKTNIGKELKYKNKSQVDPLPRTALVGYALSTGLNLKVEDMSIKMISIDWSSEAHDLLVIRRANNDIEYQGFTGDINFWDNVILGKSDEKVESHHGFRFQFFDFIGIGFGRFNGPVWDGINTEGFTITLKGFLKALFLAGVGELDFAANHFDFQYSWSQYNTDEVSTPLNNTTYQSITFSIYGF